MQYDIIMPPKSLHPYVKYFWTATVDPRETPNYKLRTLVDDSCGLIFQRSDVSSAVVTKGEVIPNAFLYGQITQPTASDCLRQFSCVGVLFHPYQRVSSQVVLTRWIITTLILNALIWLLQKRCIRVPLSLLQTCSPLRMLTSITIGYMFSSGQPLHISTNRDMFLRREQYHRISGIAYIAMQLQIWWKRSGSSMQMS